MLRSLKGHKGRVNSVSVHPSGKVALSVGKDRTLYMWDLMRGRRAASMKLGFGESWTRRVSPETLRIFLCIEGELVRWSTTGSMLIVQHERNITVYSTVRCRYPFRPLVSYLASGTGNPIRTGAHVSYTRYQVCPESRRRKRCSPRCC